MYAALGSIQHHVADLQASQHDDYHGEFDPARELADAYHKAIAETYIPQRYTKLGVGIYPAGERGLPFVGADARPVLRDLRQQDDQHLNVTLDLTLPGCDDGTLPAQTVRVWFLPPGSATGTLSGWVGVVQIESVVFEDGKATVSVDENNVYDSAGDKTDLCVDCIVIAAGSHRDCTKRTTTTPNVKVRIRATLGVGASDRIQVTDVDRDLSNSSIPVYTMNVLEGDFRMLTCRTYIYREHHRILEVNMIRADVSNDKLMRVHPFTLSCGRVQKFGELL